MRCRDVCTAAIAAGLLLFSSPAARARDLELLARLLIPAYLHQQLATVCTAHRPSFFNETAGPRGTMWYYGEHVKQEVIATLAEDDALKVLRMAADTARFHNRRLFALLDEEAGQTERWCAEVARPMVLSFISTHDDRHDEFNRIVADARGE